MFDPSVSGDDSDINAQPPSFLNEIARRISNIIKSSKSLTSARKGNNNVIEGESDSNEKIFFSQKGLFASENVKVVWD